ncbi:MAG: OmpH family outer membrane protein [Bacteroidota bacterium]
MKKLQNILLIAQAIVVIGTCVWAVTHFSQTDKMGYVQLNTVYSDFSLKQELEAQLDKVQNKRSAVLDSLRMDLEALARTLDNQPAPDENQLRQFEVRRQTYLAKEQQFTEDNQRLAAQYREQVWKQINQYVRDYGQAEGYRIIHGADGTGGLMFAEEALDVTEAVTAYINTRYNGQS